MPRAVRFDRYGGIDVLYIGEVDRPVPGGGQVLVRVKAAGINPGEATIREGAFDSVLPVTFPSGQGSDLAEDALHTAFAAASGATHLDRAHEQKEDFMEQVTARDGTKIAFDRMGDGPPVILVGGAFNTRSFGPNEGLATLLAEHFTVINYDRRGRGDSGDTAPYAVEREVEDMEALIEEVGGSAYVFGISSGAALALEAANRGLGIEKLALYEAPFVVDDSRPPVPDDYLERLEGLVASGRRGDAVRLFMREGIGLPVVFVAMMRFMPAWSKLKAVSHTVVYDAAIVDDYQKGHPLPAGRWDSVSAPTLVAVGGKSSAWMRHAMQALADVLPNARHRTLEGQTHIVMPEALAPVLTEFFVG
jgi:pimeloyl-ACP methyl ester carboxylesterase